MADWLDGYYENKKLLENTLNIDPGGGPTPPDDSVTNAILAPMDANTVKVNATALAENPTNLAMAASTVLGRGPTGNIDDLLVGSGLVVTNTTIGRAALTGDVTASADGNVTTIADDAVTNAKAADMVANSIKANPTTGTASPQDVSISASQLAGRGPTGNIAGLTVGAGLTITDTTIGRPALTGDVTASADSNATTIATDAVTTAKIIDNAVTAAKILDANVTTSKIALNAVGNARLAKGAANTLKGNPTGALADLQDMTIQGGLSMDGTSKIKAKSSISYGYTYSNNTTMGDPGSGGIRFNNTIFSSITQVAISNTTLLSRIIDTFMGTWASGGRMSMMANDVSSIAYGVFDITAVQDNTTYFVFTITPIDGSIPTNGSEVLISYDRPSSGLTSQDVLDMNITRFDANFNLIDKNSVVRSGSPSVADYAALVALNPATYENFAVVVSSGVNRSVWVSNGTAFGPLNGQYIQAKQNTPGNFYVYPGNVTWTAADNGSGKVRLTSSAAHGITETNAEGSYLYLISGGTGWTAGTSHKITSGTGYVSTTQLDLDTNYTASMGVPVFAKAGTVDAESEIPLLSITLPVLRTNSSVILEFSVEFSDDAGTGIRRTKMDLDTTEMFTNGVGIANTRIVNYRWGFRNQNATNSQRGIAGSTSNGTGSNTSAPIDAAVDTSVAKTMTIITMANNIGQTARIGAYDLLIRG